MTQDDLTRVKHIGPSRMKVLNDNGITTIKQLFDAPLEKLVQIESIGERYAKLIKDAVVEYYDQKPEQPPAKTKPAKKQKIQAIDQDLAKLIKTLGKSLRRVNENLKPLDKKKLVEPYIQYKKRSNSLKTRLKEFDQLQKDLPKKLKKKILKKADTLNTMLKNTGKKPKKKKYQALSKQIRSFSKAIKEARP